MQIFSAAKSILSLKKWGLYLRQQRWTTRTISARRKGKSLLSCQQRRIYLNVFAPGIEKRACLSSSRISFVCCIKDNIVGSYLQFDIWIASSENVFNHFDLRTTSALRRGGSFRQFRKANNSNNVRLLNYLEETIFSSNVSFRSAPRDETDWLDTTIRKIR